MAAGISVSLAECKRHCAGIRLCKRLPFAGFETHRHAFNVEKRIAGRHVQAIELRRIDEPFVKILFDFFQTVESIAGQLIRMRLGLFDQTTLRLKTDTNVGRQNIIGQEPPKSALVHDLSIEL